MVEIRRNLVNTKKYNIKCPYEMEAEFIVVHNTANDATAQNEIAYMIRNDNKTSFHYAIDDKEIVQGIPVNRNSWNAGDGGNGKGNRKGISIEICYSKSGGERFIQAEKNAAEFIASLLKARGWGIDRVTKHQDYDGKYCPHRTLDMGWDRFLNMISAHLNVAPVEPAPAPAPTVDIEQMARDVIAGQYGNGQERKDALGSNYSAVQKRVNEILAGQSTPQPAKKSIDTLAREVIQGKWGNGAERKRRLEAAGYNYSQVQKRVNELV